MNVAIVLEDFPRDQFIAVPAIQALFQHLGTPAKVTALPERMGSVEQAMDLQLLLPVVAARAPMTDLILLLVDRDCRAPDRPREGNRESALIDLEHRVTTSGALGTRCRFLACQAIEELEVWLLAGFDIANWAAVRNECDPKETYFEPFAKERHVYDLPADGRQELMREAVRRYRRIRTLCPELQTLEQRISRLGDPEILH